MTLNKKRSNNDVYQGEIVRSLHKRSIYTRSSFTGRFTQTDPGSADLFFLIHGLGGVIEVKTGYNNSFSFSEWRDNQRQWAADFKERNRSEYWLALVIETEYSPWRVPRAAFLISYNRLLMAMENCPIDSIPYLAGKGNRIDMQINHLDAKFLWAGDELIWAKGSWDIPPSSLFHQTYLQGN